MTPEAQITAICSVMPKGFLFGFKWCFQGQWRIFDPLNDLNAMHEAEKALTLEQWDKYIDRLDDWVPSMRNVAHATASERAEALLRTLNLWTDEQ